MMRTHWVFRGGAVLAVSLVILAVCRSVGAELIHQEGFNTNGDGTRYTLFEPDWIDSGDSGPAMWTHNFEAERIGLPAAAPDKRAAILWDHNALADDFTPESLEVWESLVGWAVEGKANATVAIFPGFEFAEGTFVVAEKLEAAGYMLEEVFTPEEIDPAAHDLLIHSSEQASTAFSPLELPIISYSASDHDDTAIAGIGASLAFFDEVVVTVDPDNADHPALGGKTGDIPWTTAGIPLQGIGKLHDGGKALAWTEHPDTEEPTAALFVIEKGDSLLGAFDPVPEGGGYIVGAAINKLDIPDERTLTIGPIGVEGKADLQLTVALAATAADFENSDYLRIEVDPDDDGPASSVILEEFFGVSDDQSDCFKGLSNGEIAGDEGPICLPQSQFEDFTWSLPANSTDVTLTFAYLSTWGNEIVGIDNVRICSGPCAGPGDYNGDGELDAADLDLQAAAIQAPAPDPNFDLTGDGNVDFGDRQAWVKDLKNTWIGDANLNGEFNSGDLVGVFTAGKYETGAVAGWAEGDWTGDGVFGSSDLVAAFTDGGYEQGPRPAAAAIPEPSTVTLAMFGLAMIMGRWRRRRS